MERQRQRQRQRQCYQMDFIITNGLVHTGAATAMAPQVNGFRPYSCGCGNGKLIVLIVICRTI